MVLGIGVADITRMWGVLLPFWIMVASLSHTEPMLFISDNQTKSMKFLHHPVKLYGLLQLYEFHQWIEALWSFLFTVWYTPGQ